MCDAYGRERKLHAYVYSYTYKRQMQKDISHLLVRYIHCHKYQFTQFQTRYGCLIIICDPRALYQGLKNVNNLLINNFSNHNYKTVNVTKQGWFGIQAVFPYIELNIMQGYWITDMHRHFLKYSVDLRCEVAGNYLHIRLKFCQ